MITNYITIMFYDLCYYILLPLACATGAAGLYYIADPVDAKNKAFNLSWSMTKFYITWSDRLGLFVNEYMHESSDSEDDEEEDENVPTKYFIFYNNEQRNSYIADEINDEIMKHVEDNIKPSIMFIRNRIGPYQYYKRTFTPEEKNTIYSTLAEKLFIQVEYVTKGKDGKENVIDIHSNLTGFYVNENIILDKKFLEWYLAQYYELNDIDDYELRIFDKDVNMLNLKSTQAIKIENDSYSIVESSTIEKKSNEKSDESDTVSKYEGATEE